MKIAELALIPWTMPKEDREWRFALGASSESRGCVAVLRSDTGEEGLGYAPEVPHLGASQGAVIDVLGRFRDRLVGRDPFEITANLAALEREVAGNHQAKAAVDIALHDLCARALGVPVCQLLGGRVRDEIPILRILALKSPPEMAANARKLVEEGYRHLKIKVGGEPRLDVERVERIRAEVGADVHLTIDVNQSYDPKTAVAVLEEIAPLRIDLAEQPVRADDFRGLRFVRERSAIPIEADESARSLADIFRLAEMEAVDSVSIKIAKLGGLRSAQQAAALCQAANLRCRVGAAVGSRILNAACMHFVAAIPNIAYACELGEYHRLIDDPAEGLDVERGVLRLPEGPGLGVRLGER